MDRVRLIDYTHSVHGRPRTDVNRKIQSEQNPVGGEGAIELGFRTKKCESPIRNNNNCEITVQINLKSVINVSNNGPFTSTVKIITVMIIGISSALISL